ncbi:MAG: hypothetical protein QNI97_08710, partial [Desulfobacterales bacterium]|nr:hypothetical protein [Desulfobacterales bacterium]
HRLSERSEFRCAPAGFTTRRKKRGTAVSFGSFSFPGKKMNTPNNKITPRIGRASPGPPPEVDGLDQD